MIYTLRKPEKLVPGDKLAIVAPASGFERTSFFKGKKELENIGFDVVYRSDIFERDGYLAGSDVRRRDELREALEDKSVKGVICARGGYGSLRILSMLDWGRPFPEKIFVGCSDITPILNVFADRLRVVAFHGPMVSGEYGISDDEEALKNLSGLLMGEREYPFTYSVSLVPLSKGRGRGRLMGGCLSLLVSLIGTPWDFDYSGSIIFIEDINEPSYRIDRMLTQLLLSGKLEKAAGIIFGEMNRCEGVGGDSIKEMIAEKLFPLKIPVLYGFPSGHSSAAYTLPLGIEFLLDADNNSFTCLESPLS